MTRVNAGPSLCLAFGLLVGLTLPGEATAGTFPYWGLTFGTPERTAAHLGLSFGDQIPSSAEDGLAIGTGPVVEVAAGMGAGKVGVGRSILILTDEKSVRVYADLRAVGTRTWARARGASPHATYLGVEGGLSIAFVRFTMGVSKRVEGRRSGADLLVTWGAGLQIRLGSGKKAGTGN